MRICVYGAASKDIAPEYLEAGIRLGQDMARKDMELVFGGGQTGMMGAVLQGMQQEHGRSIGVAPKFFDVPGILSESCSEFIFTDTMRQRKQIMEDLADAFIMTPGGIGTYEEFFEILTLKQLQQTNKPLAVLNIDGYFDPLLEMLRQTAHRHFMNETVFELFYVSSSVTDCLDFLERAEQ